MCNPVTRITIRKALRKPAPARVPLSGEKAKENDCYIVTVEAPGGAWSGWVRSSNADGVECRVYGEEDEAMQVSWRELTAYKVIIKHYYRYFTFTYDSPGDLLLWEWSGYYRWRVLREDIAQYTFNKVRLVRAGRIEVLRHFIAKSIETGGYKVSHIDLVTDLHGVRAFGRSDVDSQLSYYRHICESLVSTGDLKEHEIEYQVTPQAIVTLSEYEEEERKHREMWKVQVILGIFAAASVVAGLLQAYVAYIK